MMVGLFFCGCEYFEDDLNYEYSVKYEVLNYSSGTYEVEYVAETGSNIELLSDDFEFSFYPEDKIPFLYFEVNNYSDSMLIIMITIDGTIYTDPVEYIKSVGRNETETIEIY